MPLLAVLALATVRLVDVGSRAIDATQVEDLTRLSTDVSELTQVMHKERMAAAQIPGDAGGPLDRRTPAPAPKRYTAAIAQTDARIQKYTADRRELDEPPASVHDRLARIDDHLHTMDATRPRVARPGQQIAVSEAVLRYGVVITDLVGYGEVVGQFAGDGEVADGLRAVVRVRPGQGGHRGAGGGLLRRPGLRRPQRRAAVRVHRHPDQPAGGAAGASRWSPRRPSAPWWTPRSPATRSTWPTRSPPG